MKTQEEKARIKVYQKEYRQRPEVKAKQKGYAKKYMQKPEVKAKNREYQQRPERKAKQKEWRERPEVKERLRAYHKKYAKEYYQRPEVKAKQKEWRERPGAREKQNAYVRRKNKENRLIVLKHYGNACQCCGETIKVFLCMDHINNDGNEQRKKINSKFYRWIIKNKFPTDLQILCFNCNSAKEILGSCPHNNKETI